MKELKPSFHDDNNGLDYVLVGAYYLPLLALPEENRPMDVGAGCTSFI